MLLLKYPLEWADFLPLGLTPRVIQSALPDPPGNSSFEESEALQSVQPLRASFLMHLSHDSYS